MHESRPKSGHIALTSHPRGGQPPAPIVWGAPTAIERGPVIGSRTDPSKRNVIGAHSGSYALYRALAIAAGKLDPVHRPDLTNTYPAVQVGPYAPWGGADRIVGSEEGRGGERGVRKGGYG